MRLSLSEEAVHEHFTPASRTARLAVVISIIIAFSTRTFNQDLHLSQMLPIDALEIMQGPCGRMQEYPEAVQFSNSRQQRSK